MEGVVGRIELLMAMKFYRYTASKAILSSDLHVYHLSYYMIKETPCGYWISDQVAGKHVDEDMKNPYFWKKWVSKTAKKRYAYPTKEEALESFLARKYRQAALARNTVEYAEEAIRKAEQIIEDKRK